MSALENPPAFPSSNDVRLPDGSGTSGHSGMTLRDWFAGQVLIGLYVNSTLQNEKIAAEAYHMADAMLAERSKKPNTP